MFKVANGRPYPATGLSPAKWREVSTKYVPIGELHATRAALSIAALAPDYREPHTADRLVHVVVWEGKLYIEEGHHRVAREALAGATHVNARVLNLDRPGPVPTGPAVAEEGPADPFLLPGLVWVEGKGYRSVHLARVLESTGGTVDWHRWSPGSEGLYSAPAVKEVA
jgi:hypothetical protein